MHQEHDHEYGIVGGLSHIFLNAESLVLQLEFVRKQKPFWFQILNNMLRITIEELLEYL